MNKIQDYKCGFENTAGASAQLAKELGLTFPDVYLHAGTMVTLAKALKEHDSTAVCEMPFCHTVEAEALGGIINLGDENAGPRAKEYLTDKMEDLLDLPPIDFSKGRIHEVLIACRELENHGYHTVLEIAGPFTMMNVLIDAKHVFKCMRKDPALAKKVMKRLGTEILRYAEEAVRHGLKLISYADSSGSVNILGPRIAEQVVNDFTYDLVKDLLGITKDKALLMLCPKTALALIGTEKAAFKDFRLSKEMTYARGCIEAAGLIPMVGEVCIKKRDHILKDGIIKEVVLI